MNYFYFKKLDVYNYSKELVKYIYLLLKKFLCTFKYSRRVWKSFF